MKKVLKFLLGFIVGFFAVALVLCIGLTIANKISEKSMHEYIDSFASVEYENQLKPQLDEYGNWYFTTDGDFKIMQITDVHLGGGCLSRTDDKKAMNAIAAMVAYEKPDLVISTGDMASTYPTAGTMNNRYAHEYFARLMEQLGVYWTVAFGNHDSEAYNFYNRDQVVAMYENEAYQYCLFSAGPEEVSGKGNHVINVKNSAGKVTQSLFMIDTHSYMEDDPFGLNWDYDYIKEDQIEWYRDMVELYCKDGEKTAKSLTFFHIPLLETKDAYWEYVNNGRQNTEGLKWIEGNDGEKDPVVFPSQTDTNMFETMVELGSTQGVFFGHDHLNNFIIEYKGIKMSYGYAIDYFAYGGIDKYGYQRGCQIIVTHQDGSCDITHENYYQYKSVPQYEKEVVIMSKEHNILV